MDLENSEVGFDNSQLDSSSMDSVPARIDCHLDLERHMAGDYNRILVEIHLEAVAINLGLEAVGIRFAVGNFVVASRCQNQD